MKFKYYLLGVISSLMVVVVAIAGYSLGSQETGQTYSSNNGGDNLVNKDNNLELAADKVGQIEEVSDERLSSGLIEDIITQSITNKNYRYLQSYFDNEVEVIIEESDCCDKISSDEAIEKLKFLNRSKGEWDFSSESTIATDLASTYPEKYSNSFLGISSDEYLVSFQINENGKIYSISMASTYKSILR